MTLRVVEGFDYFPENPSDFALGAAGWSSDVADVRCLTDTAFGYGRAFAWTGSNNFDVVYKFLRGRYTGTYTFGMRIRIPTAGIPTYTGFGGFNGVYGIYGYDVNSTRPFQWNIGFDQFGTITLITYTNGNPAIRATSAPWAFVPGNWGYLEVQITPGDSTSGSIEIRMNTVPVLVLTGIRTSDGSPIAPASLPGITHMGFYINRIGADSFSITVGNQFRFDDYYFLDDAGALNNDFLGNVRVKYMAVIGNATPIQWDIGGSSPAPTNWQSVLNLDLNDTRYVVTSVVNDLDLYSVDPNLDTPYVYGIEVSGAYRQDDATQRFVKNVLKSGASQVEGTEHAVNQSYTYYFDIFETNPDTGLPFTGIEANAVDIGPKLTG